MRGAAGAAAFLATWSPFLFAMVAAAAVTVAVVQHYNGKEKEQQYRSKEEQRKKRENFPECVWCRRKATNKLEPCGHDMCLVCAGGISKTDGLCIKCGTEVTGRFAKKRQYKCAHCKEVQNGGVVEACGHFLCQRCSRDTECPACNATECVNCKEVNHEVVLEPCGHSLCKECFVYALNKDRKCPVCSAFVDGPAKLVKKCLFPKKCMICRKEELVRNLPCRCRTFCKTHALHFIEIKGSCSGCDNLITGFDADL